MTQIMKNIKNVFTTKRNNRGLFFQLSIFALFAIMTLFSEQTLACTTSVLDDPSFPGGVVSFAVSSDTTSYVTIDSINFGLGLQKVKVVGGSLPAGVTSVPALPVTVPPPGYAPFTITFTGTGTFWLHAGNTLRRIYIRVRC